MSLVAEDLRSKPLTSSRQGVLTILIDSELVRPSKDFKLPFLDASTKILIQIKIPSIAINFYLLSIFDLLRCCMGERSFFKE